MRRTPTGPHVLGVDGWRGGWVAVAHSLVGDAPCVAILADFASVRATLWGCAEMTAVDMPIGLPETGRRACERETRRFLGPRRSSVFAAPRRPMLAFEDYESANAWGKAQGIEAGGGLSRQAWNIMPKIREVDAAIKPSMQAKLGEAHPEAAFARLAGAPCLHGKKTLSGRAERLSILTRSGMPDAISLIEAVRDEYGAKGPAPDDILDACVLALTARDRLAGSALRFSDDAKDARGLVMEIWA